MSDIARLFIAEKPSLAGYIATALGEMTGKVPVKEGRAWRVGKDVVASLVGHMYETAEPKAYGDKWAKWTIEALPMVVGDNEWKLVPHDDKKDLIAGVRKLISSSAVVINAGDPGREGQLLVDELLVEAGRNPFGPDVLRLWVKSMATKDMISALSSMGPNRDKKGYYDSAVCRQRADWQHGMNFSRLFTLLASRSGSQAKISVGRVQTPTLWLVVDRDRERLGFKPVDHFIPRITFIHENGVFQALWMPPADYAGMDSEGRLTDKSVADSIISKLAGKAGKVRSWKNDLKIVPPPLLFSLDALTSECGSKFGMTAQETLDTAQALYEKHKATTYPRTDSRYLPLAILQDEAPGILDALARVEELGDGATKVNRELRSGAWDDSKTSEHHGIIPTSEFKVLKLAAMSTMERQVFMLVARSFLAQFHPGFRYRALAAEVACEGLSFKATGRQVVDQGWKVVYGADEQEEGEEAEQTLPSMSQGDPVTGGRGELNPKRTSAPSAFNDGTLIQAMVNVHRFVTDEAVKRRLKETDGIGTSATRAATIEMLLRRTFLRRKGKNGLESTELGRSIIDVLPDGLKDPGLTALWEGWLGEVQEGNMEVTTFMRQQSDTIRKMVDAYRNTRVVVKGAPTVRPMEGHDSPCPACARNGVAPEKRGVLQTQEVRQGDDKGKRYLRCSNRETCEYSRREAPKVPPALHHGEVCPLCKEGKLETRLVSKEGPSKGKPYLVCNLRPLCAHIQWPERAEVKAIAGDGAACTKCGTGVMHTRVVSKDGPNKGKSFLGCNNRECTNMIFPEPVTEALAGTGKACPECGQGKMRTKAFNGKDGTLKRLLVCTSAPGCKHEEWPPRDGQVAAKPGSAAPAKTVRKK